MPTQDKRLCKKCGTEFLADAPSCPKCGLAHEVTVKVAPSKEMKQLDLATKELAASINQLAETIRRITQQKMAQRVTASPSNINDVTTSGQIVSQQVSTPSTGTLNQVCSECHQSYPSSEVIKCYECGRLICEKCSGPTFSLGVCPPCEEVFEGEEDYYNWS